MALQNGALVKNRMRITLDAGQTDVDTGLRQPRVAFDPDPGLNGVLGLVASRVMVHPMAPLANWAAITHGEPFVDPATGTVHVEFTNGGEQPVEINVLFDSVHTLEGPVSAEPYNAPQQPPG